MAAICDFRGLLSGTAPWSSSSREQNNSLTTLTIAAPDGVDFGAGPTVLLFDRFKGSNLQILEDGREADVGTWTTADADVGAMPRLYFDSETNRTWFARRDPTLVNEMPKYSCQMFKFLDMELKEFRFSQRRWVPSTFLFPAATTLGSLAGVPSSDKPTWFGYGTAETGLTGITAPNANIVFDSHQGSGSFYNGGNSTQPQYFDSYPRNIYTGFSFVRPTFSSWYQSGIETPEDTGTYGLIGDSLVINGEDNVRNIRAIDAIANSETTTRYYNCFDFGGWFGNAPGDPANYANMFTLSADCYLAVGANSRACVITSDNAVLLNSNEAYTIPPTWANSEIKVNVEPYENLGHVHVMLADGTLIQDIQFTESVATGAERQIYINFEDDLSISPLTTWGTDSVLVTTNEPYSGTQCLRGNLGSGLAGNDPITGKPRNNSPLNFDIFALTSGANRTWNQAYVRYKLRFDDADNRNENNTPSTPKLGYFSDTSATFETGDSIWPVVEPVVGLRSLYKNSNTFDPLPAFTGGAPQGECTDCGLSYNGEWNDIEILFNYLNSTVEFWINGIKFLGYSEATDGFWPINPVFRLDHIRFFHGNDNVWTLSANGTEEKCGFQIDEIEVYDAKP